MCLEGEGLISRELIWPKAFAFKISEFKISEKRVSNGDYLCGDWGRGRGFPFWEERVWLDPPVLDVPGSKGNAMNFIFFKHVSCHFYFANCLAREML